jgi:S-adenosylmethionine synthetase
MTHTGKLHALVAERAAHELARSFPFALDVQCLLVSQIGRAIDDPLVADVRVALAAGASDGDALDRRAREVLERTLSELPRLREQLVAGVISVV